MNEFKVGQTVRVDNKDYAGVTSDIGVITDIINDSFSKGCYVEVQVDYEPFSDELYYFGHEISVIAE